MEAYIISDTSETNLKKEMHLCGVSSAGIKLMINKGLFFAIKLTNTDNRGLNILKQESLAAGAETSVSRHVGDFTRGKSDGLLLATKEQIHTLIPKLRNQPFGLKELADTLTAILNNKLPTYKIRSKTFNFQKKKYVMGILNITPDSFYDGRRYTSQKAMETKIKQMLKNRVDIIDIGAESTRPGAQKISLQEEKKRLLPALKLVRSLTDTPISVDTYKSEAADTALDNGADMINDISGLQFDKKMASVIARHSASAVLMHIKGTPRTMQKNPQYKNLMMEIINYLKQSISIAEKHHIKQLIIDPGIGFGKTVLHNYEILHKLRELQILPYPVLIGLSRKSLIGKVLNNTPEERLPATMALNLVALLNGASLIRVHDVKEGKQTVALANQFSKIRGNP